MMFKCGRQVISRILVIATITVVAGGCTYGEQVAFNFAVPVIEGVVEVVGDIAQSSSKTTKPSPTKTAPAIPKGYCFQRNGARTWTTERECNVKSGLYRTSSALTHEKTACRLGNVGSGRFEVLTEIDCRAKNGWISMEPYVACSGVSGSSKYNLSAFDCMKRGGKIEEIMEASTATTPKPSPSSTKSQCHYGGGVIAAGRTECAELGGVWK